MSAAPATTNNRKLAALQRCHLTGCILWAAMWLAGSPYMLLPRLSGIIYHPAFITIISLAALIPILFRKKPKAFILTACSASILLTLLFVGWALYLHLYHSRGPSISNNSEIHRAALCLAITKSTLSTALFAPWIIATLRCFPMIFKKKKENASPPPG